MFIIIITIIILMFIVIHNITAMLTTQCLFFLFLLWPRQFPPDIVSGPPDGWPVYTASMKFHWMLCRDLEMQVKQILSSILNPWAKSHWCPMLPSQKINSYKFSQQSLQLAI